MDSMQEYDLERIVMPEIDGAILMELLEDSCIDEDDDGDYSNYAAVDDRLGYVIRSLEAEIGAEGAVAISDGESTTSFNDESDDGGLEEMLSDFDGRDGAVDVTYDVEEPFDWSEMEVVGSAMGEWFMDVEEGEVGYVGEGGECYGHGYYGEGSMEQVYSSLWE